jgi:transcriptional regulator with XRE-family HTH domain
MAKQRGATNPTDTRITGRLAPVSIKVNGATVAALRQLNGFGLKELAETSGVSMSYICEVEKGTKVNLRPPTIKKLADALGVTVAVLARDPEAAEEYFRGQAVA